MRNSSISRALALALLGCFLAASAASAAEYATFDAFYEEGGLLGWTSVILAGVVALGVAAFIFFTGGTGGPVVAAIGSWIGGTMGLSGAATTNAGLALLGGGSLAAGGLGMAGGAAVLTGVLTFSGELVISVSTEYLWNSIHQKYDYEKLQEESAQLVTLPLPVNTSGSDAYGQAMEILGEIDEKQPIQSSDNQRVIARAISELRFGLEFTEDAEYRVKDRAMVALLYFLHNDYREAQKWARQAITLAQSEDMAYTLPQFIYAASLLVTRPDNFNESVWDLRQAVLGESDNSYFPGDQPNKLILVMFATYLDRMVLLYAQGELPDDAFAYVAGIVEADSLSKLRPQNLTLLLFREIGLMKIYRQKILAILATDNARIRKSPDTARYLETALRRYATLFEEAASTLRKLSASDLDPKIMVKISQETETELKTWRYHDLVGKICRFSAEQGTNLGICDFTRRN